MNARPRPWLAGVSGHLATNFPSGSCDEIGMVETVRAPGQSVVQAVAAAALRLHHYPDSLAGQLRSRLADEVGAHPRQVLVGSGSDELIHLLVLAYAAAGGTVLCADPPYWLHEATARRLGAQVTKVPLVAWAHDLDTMASVSCDLAFVTNPHNPTGTVVPGRRVGNFVRRAKAGLVAIDEAYVDFTEDPIGTSALALAVSGDAVVIRTFSKLWGLAGLRVGYLVGPVEVVDVLRTVRVPYSVNTIAQAAALAALADRQHAERVRDETLEMRTRLLELLEEFGFVTVPSEANFVLMLTDREDLFAEELRRAGLQVKSGTALGVAGAVRVTVPSRAGINRCRTALARLVAMPDGPSPGNS